MIPQDETYEDLELSDLIGFLIYFGIGIWIVATLICWIGDYHEQDTLLGILIAQWQHITALRVW